MGTATPRSPEEMTPGWLTMALRSGGAIGNTSVTARRIEPIGAGAGFLGQLARVHLEYDRPEPSAPKTAIIKLPTLDPGGREICRMFQFYEREISFYDHVASSCNVRVPKAYYTAVDAGADNYLLLLEDLVDVRMGDEVAGCDAAEAEMVVRGIAEFHAKWWDSPRLAQLDWMPAVNAPVQQIAEPAYNQAWEPFVQNFGAMLSPRMLSIGEQMKAHVVHLQDALAPAPMTILHGDWRLDNIFFGANSVAAIDWQISTKGRGAFDVAYFLSSCIDPEIRRANEMAFLKTWHEIAADGGSGGYSFDDALTDYRRAVLFCNVYTVIAIGTLDPANERGVALLKAWLTRRSAAIEELDADELMPK